MEINDRTVIKLLQGGHESAFEQVFKAYFKCLHAYAYTILRNNDTAEEMVQQVFFRIWERKEQLKTDGSLKAYLYRSVHNECLNHLKHQKVKASYQVYYTQQMEQGSEHTAKKVLSADLQKQLHKALNELPQQCRTVFQLSRFEQLKYREIAVQLGVSVKTVENHMGKALKILRLRLAEFLPLLWYLFTGF